VTFPQQLVDGLAAPVSAPSLLIPLAAVLSFLLCWAVDRLARQRGWIDQPSPRRIHSVPIPRLGGVGMALAFLPLAWWLGEQTLAPNLLPELHWGLVGAGLLTLSQIPDDLIGLPPWLKLLAQVAVAVLAMAAGLRIDHVSTPLNNPFDPNPLASPVALPLALAIPATVLWFVGMINAVNALDGIDGLAGGVVAIAAGVLALHTARYMGQEIGVAYLLGLLSAVCIGFLVWNWPPARLIMGDTGSHFLGFALAMLSILGGARLATALLVLGIPILDYAYVIYSRLRSGRAAMHYDLGHLQHRLLYAGLPRSAILALLYSVTVLAGVAALFLEKTQKLFGFGALLALAFGVIIALPHAMARRQSSRASAGARSLRQGGEAQQGTQDDEVDDHGTAAVADKGQGDAGERDHLQVPGDDHEALQP
jgi:UDP-GlcNAc:undecaprenyl-phosphate GlcNAc-1-phosphate transferase